jgi:hypothetical protein
LACTFDTRNGENLIRLDEYCSDLWESNDLSWVNYRGTDYRYITDRAIGFNPRDRDIDNDGNRYRAEFSSGLKTGNSQDLIGSNKYVTKFRSCPKSRDRDNRLGCYSNIANFAGGLNPVFKYVGICGNSDITNKASSFNPRNYLNNSDEDLNTTKLSGSSDSIWEYACLGYNKNITKLPSSTYPSYNR